MAALYNFLLNYQCPICLNNFRDGSEIEFSGSCWVHPLCGECKESYDMELENRCPSCHEHYDGSVIPFKIEVWPRRAAANYPPIQHVGQPSDLVGHQAPCCEFGFESGDFVVGRSCDYETIHYMHTWCFLMRWLEVDGDAMRRKPPFYCLTCHQMFENRFINCKLRQARQEHAEDEDYTDDDDDDDDREGDNIEEDDDNENRDGEEEDDKIEGDYHGTMQEDDIGHHGDKEEEGSDEDGNN